MWLIGYQSLTWLLEIKWQFFTSMTENKLYKKTFSWLMWILKDKYNAAESVHSAFNILPWDLVEHCIMSNASSDILCRTIFDLFTKNRRLNFIRLTVIEHRIWILHKTGNKRITFVFKPDINMAYSFRSLKVCDVDQTAKF